MPISKLSFSNVGPFDDIEFEFDPQVNVFTGPNNVGKSTALWVLGDTAVYPFDFPEKLLRPGGDAEFELYADSGSDPILTGHLPFRTTSVPHPDDPKHELLRDYISVLKMIGYSEFIPALRRSTDFRSLGPTPSIVGRVGPSIQMTQEELFPELKKRLALFSDDASLVSDEEVIQEIIDLDYRSYLRKEPALHNTLVQVGEIASEITDRFLIKFTSVAEDNEGFFPEFSTVDGPMPLNTLSQGTQSIVQWLGRLLIGYASYYDFPKTLRDKPGVLIIDEIDAHLHPSWQRRIIPTLTKHFPSLQIFCSTHSPLMLAGLKEGQIQLLQRDENDDDKVKVSTNDVDLVAWSADEILRNFLGVREPTDQETVEKLERMRKLQGKRDLSREESKELDLLSSEVNADLMNGPAAAQVDRFIQALEKAKAGGEL